jgi:hypothetical protein
MNQEQLHNSIQNLAIQIKNLAGLLQNDITKMLKDGEITLGEVKAAKTSTDKQFVKNIKEFHALRTATLEFLDNIIKNHEAPQQAMSGSGLKIKHEITWTRKVIDTVLGQSHETNHFEITLYDQDSQLAITTFSVTLEIDQYNDKKYTGPAYFRTPTMYVYENALPKAVEDNWITCRRCGKRDQTITRNECDYCYNESMNGK